MPKGIIYLAQHTGETVRPVRRQAMSVTMPVAANGAPRSSLAPGASPCIVMSGPASISWQAKSVPMASPVQART